MNWTAADIDRLKNKGLKVSEYNGFSVKKSKYGNKKTEVDGKVFDSKKESLRYKELQILELAGKITGLKLQETFEIIINEMLVCKYKADFSYQQDGKTVVEDCKGFKTPAYRLKKKLLKAVLGIEILET